MTWQLIDTAPKDGTEILVFNTDGNIYQAEWNGDYWSFVVSDQHGCGCCGGDAEFPTHWMPLPELPGRLRDDS